MKSSTLLLLALTLISTAAEMNAQSGWLLQASGTTKSLMGVCLRDTVNATVVGMNGTVLCTSDGGATWTSQFEPGIGGGLRAVRFTNRDTGTAVGGYEVGGNMGASYGPGVIYRTTNGGRAWEEQAITAGYLHAVSFPDASNGWAVGYSYEYSTSGRPYFHFSGGEVVHSSDGGGSWTVQKFDSSSSGWYESVFFVDSTVGTVVGRNGTILHTTDGGNTWMSQSSGTDVSLLAISFTDVNIGTVVGHNGTILRTTDGGAIWTAQPSGTLAALRGAFFSQAGTGVVVGDSGTILRTTDGGLTWIHQLSGTAEDLNGVCFAHADCGTAVGKGGAILRTTTGGVTWIRDEQSHAGEFPEVFSLNQNYPNPFNPSTTIRYELPQRSHVTLSVFNALGQKVATLVEGEMEAGSHEVRFDAAHLASGVYVYRLVAGAHVQARKLSLLR